MVNIIIDARLSHLRRNSIIIPAQDVISTNLVVTPRLKSIPTLVSVEHILGRLGGVGLIPAHHQDAIKLAELVNSQFLAVSESAWREARVMLDVQRCDDEQSSEALRAVNALRDPTLASADAIVQAEARGMPGEVRRNEDQFVRSVGAAAVREKSTWARFGKTILTIAGTTVLGTLSTQLVGVPIISIAHKALAGFGQ